MKSKNRLTSLPANTKQLELIVEIEPILHWTAVALRVLQWKGIEKKYSLMCLSSWILLGSTHHYILSLLPLVLLLLYAYIQYKQSTKTRTEQKQHHHQYYQVEPEKEDNDDGLSLLQDLTDIRDTLQLCKNLKNWLQQSDTLCNAYHTYAIGSKRLRSFVCVAVSCLFIIVYAGWVILLQLYQLSSLLWISVLAIMCLHSPWVRPIQAVFVRAILSLLYSSQEEVEPILSPKYNMEKNARQYRFEVYHHQRWWFPTGWSNLLLPQDRAVWTDIHLEETPSIDNFRLPPTTLIREPNDKKQKVISWTWSDPTWHKQYNKHTTDEAGWEYGTWHWKRWGSLSSSLGICTRRQKWYRHAQRTEYWTDIVKEEEEEDDELEDNRGSDTSVSSTYSSNWDNQSTTTTSNLSQDSIPVSFDNKGERMLHRRSSNLSNKSVTFNTPESFCNSPSADDMYNKYCKTPRPQRINKFII